MISDRVRRDCGVVLSMVLIARAGEAVQNVDGATAAPVAQVADSPFAFDGPPAPVPPAVITRDASGRATIRAVLPHCIRMRVVVGACSR